MYLLIAAVSVLVVTSITYYVYFRKKYKKVIITLECTKSSAVLSIVTFVGGEHSRCVIHQDIDLQRDLSVWIRVIYQQFILNTSKYEFYVIFTRNTTPTDRADTARVTEVLEHMERSTRFQIGTLDAYDVYKTLQYDVVMQ